MSELRGRAALPLRHGARLELGARLYEQFVSASEP
jgi:hypothetical protein